METKNQNDRKDTPQEWKDSRVEKEKKIEELVGRIDEGVREVFQSENYVNYLKIMSRFHSYSVRNTILIRLQKPEAQLVAGYRDWQRKFQRHVKKGAKAIWILSPVTVKAKQAAGAKTQGEEDNAKTEREEEETNRTRTVAFTYKPVYDVSDTEGKPLPELLHNLIGNVEGYQEFLYAARKVSPVTICFQPIKGSARGYFSFAENRIVLRPGMEETQTLKTLIHEMTHSLLHNKAALQERQEKGLAMDKNTIETEAESTAFVVCQYFGVDTSEYSFPYITSWSSSRETKELKDSLSTIRSTAGMLIDELETRLRQIREEPSYTICQISEKPEAEEYRRRYQYMGSEYVEKNGDFDFSKYVPVYTDEWTKDSTPDGIYEKFNNSLPADFTGHSLSVSDVITVKNGEECKAWYVDSFGFKEVSELLDLTVKVLEDNVEEREQCR